MNPKALETRNCRTPNCDRIANTKYKRGPYSGLCDEVCLPAKRVEMSQKHQQIAAERSGKPALQRQIGAPPLRTEKPATSFEQKAKGLVAVGKRLDQAVARFKPAKATLAEAMAEWKSAVRALAEGESVGS